MVTELYFETLQPRRSQRHFTSAIISRLLRVEYHFYSKFTFGNYWHFRILRNWFQCHFDSRRTCIHRSQAWYLHIRPGVASFRGSWVHSRAEQHVFKLKDIMTANTYFACRNHKYLTKKYCVPFIRIHLSDAGRAQWPKLLLSLDRTHRVLSSALKRTSTWQKQRIFYTLNSVSVISKRSSTEIQNSFLPR